MKLFLVVGMVICVSLGCATMNKSVSLGLTSGAIAGAVVGDHLAKRNKGRATLQGTLVTGAIGGLAGYLIHEALENRDEQMRREILFSLDKLEALSPRGAQPSGPSLSIPKVEAQWVETQIRGKRLIEGHRVWVITEDPQWVSEPKAQIKLKTKNKMKRKANKKRIKKESFK